MGNWIVDDYRRELETFARNGRNHIDDSYVSWYKLEELAEKLGFRAEFSINLEDFHFILDKKIAKTVPTNVNQYKIFLNISSKIDTSKNFTEVDPIESYNMDIEISGVVPEKNTPNRTAWHLDKDIREPGDGYQKFSHPYYHLQHGGKCLEGIGTGDVLLMGSPRIPHPPMDIFLAIHFILTNFYSARDYIWLSKLIESDDYAMIVDKSREKLIQPYFLAFRPSPNHRDFTLSNVFPLASA